MMYTVLYSPKARKQVRKLERLAQDRIGTALERARDEPYRHSEKVIGSTFYRIRAGDYRIVVDIQDKVLIVLVIEVAHRSTIYRFYEQKAEYKMLIRERLRKAYGSR